MNFDLGFYVRTYITTSTAIYLPHKLYWNRTCSLFDIGTVITRKWLRISTWDFIRMFTTSAAIILPSFIKIGRIEYCYNSGTAVIIRSATSLRGYNISSYLTTMFHWIQTYWNFHVKSAITRERLLLFDPRLHCRIYNIRSYLPSKFHRNQTYWLYHLKSVITHKLLEPPNYTHIGVFTSWMTTVVPSFLENEFLDIVETTSLLEHPCKTIWTLPEHGRNITITFPTHHWNTTASTVLEHHRNIPGASLEYCRNTAGTSSKHRRNITGTSLHPWNAIGTSP